VWELEPGSSATFNYAGGNMELRVRQEYDGTATVTASAVDDSGNFGPCKLPDGLYSSYPTPLGALVAVALYLGWGAAK